MLDVGLWTNEFKNLKQDCECWLKAPEPDTLRETQRQIVMDVPDYMPEECPRIIVAMQSTSRTEDRVRMIVTSIALA